MHLKASGCIYQSHIPMIMTIFHLICQNLSFYQEGCAVSVCDPLFLASGGSFYSSILGTQRPDILLQFPCLVLKHCRATFKGENIIVLELKDASSRPSFWFLILPGYVSKHMYLGFLTQLQKAVKINCL